MSRNSIPSNDAAIERWIGRQLDRQPDPSDPHWRRKALRGRRLPDLMAGVPTRADMKASVVLGEYTALMRLARAHGHQDRATLVREALYEWALKRGAAPEDFPQIGAGK